MAFDLTSVSRARRLRAPKIVIYGPPKVGKSTLATQAPNSVGIITEEGLDNIEATAFPLAKSYDDVESAIGALFNGGHDYQSVFVDSLDWLEPLILDKICKENDVDNIEKIGYGKGYIMADNLWRRFFDGLNALRDNGMTVICLAHEQVNKVRNPTLPEDHDAYSLKLNKRAVGIITEWADVIGFASYEIHTRVVDPKAIKKEVKAVGGPLRRKLYMNPSPAYVAGNRYGLPDLDLPDAATNWAVLANALAVAMTK